MLEKSEKIEGIDLKAVFTKMLKELSWDGLKAYVLSNPQLNKICTMGGFRFDPKARPRIEQFVMREAERNEFSDIQCNGVFAAWYPVHKQLHKQLEDYFHSDEYKSYLETSGLGPDEYVLSEERFNEFYNAQDFEAWRILLCFSPLKFSEAQRAKVLEDKKDDADIMSRISNAEGSARDFEKKVAQLNAENEKLRQRQQSDAQELQELRRANRQLKLDNEQLQKRAEIAVAEMKRSNQQVASSTQQVQAKETAVREELGRVISRQESDIARLNKELLAWQGRHEEQCAVNRGFVERANASEKRANEAIAAKDEYEHKLIDINNGIDALLSRVDWARIGSDMKLNPIMKRSFTSLLKSLDYDENRSLTIEGTLPAFWNRLMANEKKLIDSISKSAASEVLNGSIKDYWGDLTEEFNAVSTTLEARSMMLGILQGIFYQNYSDEDLSSKSIAPKAEKSEKAPKAPAKPKAPKADKAVKEEKAPKSAKSTKTAKSEKSTAKTTKTTAAKTTAKKAKVTAE